MPIEPIDVIHRKPTNDGESPAAAKLLNSVTSWVQVEVDVIIPVFPHTSTLTPADGLAAELRGLRDVHNVPVHDVLQVASSVKAGILQNVTCVIVVG